MPLVYIDGFEDGQVLSYSGNGQIGTGGRTGKSIYLPTAASYAQMGLDKVAAGGAAISDILVCGFARKATNYPNNGPLVTFLASAATWHFAVYCNTNNGLYINGPDGTSYPPSGTGILINNQWQYFEVKARLHDTAGQVEVRVDGNTVINMTNFDTKHPLNGVVMNIEWWAQGSPVWVDDFYLQVGSLADPFLGICEVDTLLPNGNGAVNQWSGSDGDSVDNYQLIDEIPPDPADYVYSSTIGAQDLYQLTDLPADTGAVYAVCPTMFVSKDEVGARSVKPLYRRAATNAGASIPLDYGTGMRQAVQQTDPETGVAWTVPNVNNLQAGLEVV